MLNKEEAMKVTKELENSGTWADAENEDNFDDVEAILESSKAGKGLKSAKGRHTKEIMMPCTSIPLPPRQGRHTKEIIMPWHSATY